MMALESIRMHFDEKLNALDLLDSLPPQESMTWLDFPIGMPAEALVVGSSHSHYIVAYLQQHGEKQREIKYCLVSMDDPINPSTMTSLPQEVIMKKPLYSPFKYVAESSSKTDRRRCAMLFRWYFILRGLWKEMQVDFVDYCRRFHYALKKIRAGQEAEGTKMGSVRSKGMLEAPMSVEDSSDPDDAESVTIHSDKSVPRKHRTRIYRQKLEQLRGLSTEISSTSNSDDEHDDEDETDYDKLLCYLSENDTLYLLVNLHEARDVSFAEQRSIPEAIPRKLFVGKLAKDNDDESEIWAYMKRNRPIGGFHEINFWVERPDKPSSPITCIEVAKQRLIHPFNKTYPKHAKSIEQGERARLTLLIKWYFIEAGFAKNIVLQETKAYPERLYSALKYIAARMGEGAAKPPQKSDSDVMEQDQPLLSLEEASLDESHIQFDLAVSPGPGEDTHPGVSLPPAAPSAQRIIGSAQIPAAYAQTLATAVPSPATAIASPRGTKRSAKFDAYRENITRIVEKGNRLTRQLNSIDEELERQDVKDENLEFQIEKLRKEHEAMLEKLRQDHKITSEKERKDILVRRAAVDREYREAWKEHARLSLAAPEI